MNATLCELIWASVLKSHSKAPSFFYIFPTAMPLKHVYFTLNCSSTAAAFTALHYLRAVRTQRKAPFSHSPSIYSTINFLSLFTTCTLTLSCNLLFKLDGAPAFLLVVSSCKQKTLHQLKKGNLTKLYTGFYLAYFVNTYNTSKCLVWKKTIILVSIEMYEKVLRTEHNPFEFQRSCFNAFPVCCSSL